MTKSYLIIGSTGLLGQALMKELKYQNIQVTGLARNNADIEIDILDEASLFNVINVQKPDVIINTAAIVDLVACEENPDLSYKINAKPSVELTKFAALNNIKYVYISTDHYFTGDGDQKHNEASTLNLCNQYAATKRMGEEFSLINETALVVRTNIVGFRGKNNKPTFIEWVIQSLKNQDSMTLFDDFYTSSIDVKSFSKLLIKLISKDASGIINLASSQVSNKQDFITGLAEKLGFSLENTNVGSLRQLDQTIDRNESLGLDVSKAELILNCPLPNLESVLDSLACEYKNRG